MVAMSFFVQEASFVLFKWKETLDPMDDIKSINYNLDRFDLDLDQS